MDSRAGRGIDDEEFNIWALDSNSNLLETWIWPLDYSVHKAHAITPVDDGTDNCVLTAGHNHPGDGKTSYLCIAQLEWDNTNLPRQGFTQVDIDTIGFTEEWKVPHVSDLGYLADWDYRDYWNWGGLRNHDSYIVIGSDPCYTLQGQISEENRAFCIAVNMDNNDEVWLNLESSHEDKFAQWARLVVAGDEIYCAGTYDFDDNGIFDSILMGMPDLSDEKIKSNIRTFSSLSFHFDLVRIAYCDEAASDFIITVAKGSDINDQSESIVIVTWDSSGESINDRIIDSEFNGYDNLHPFALRYYPGSNAAILLLSYRKINAIANNNRIAAYKISLSDNGTIGTVVQLGFDYSVPFQFVPDNCGQIVQLHAIIAKDFYFTDDGSDIREFAGYGCGIMRNNYSGTFPNHYKHNWLFEFEHRDTDSSPEICFEVSAIRTHCPSYNGIQFYSVPEEYGERFDVSVFDLSGRQIVQCSDLSAVDLLSSGIRGIQQGVYFMHIRCIGRNEYHNVKCIVLD